MLEGSLEPGCLRFATVCLNHRRFIPETSLAPGGLRFAAVCFKHQLLQAFCMLASRLVRHSNI